MAGEGYAVVQPYVQKAVDGTKDTLGPIFGPTLGPYWAAFSTHVANSYAESHKLARGKYFLLHLFNRSSRRKRGMASTPLFIVLGFFCIFQTNFAMAILGSKEMGKFLWELRKKVCSVGCLSQFSFAKLRQPTG